MYDANLVDFYGRVARFEKARAKGYAHEAAGTLGAGDYFRVKRRSRLRILPILMIGLCAFGMKAAIYTAVGAASYESRVESLTSGQGFDRFGGWLMQADPVTVYMSGKIVAAKNAFKY